MLRNNEHNNAELQEDWNKYGESSFSFEILGEYGTEEESMRREQELIDRTIGSSYNIGSSVNGGDLFTNNPRKEDIREIRRQQASGKNNPMHGVPK
ncbi:hypothetical protein D7Z54_32395, partial [Salibacterium salarium]